MYVLSKPRTAVYATFQSWIDYSGKEALSAKPPGRSIWSWLPSRVYTMPCLAEQRQRIFWPLNHASSGLFTSPSLFPVCAV